MDSPDNRQLVLLGTWNDLEDSLADSVRAAIRERGAWASWWSFPVREEFQSELQGPFYVYLNSGGATINYRMLVDAFESVRGNEGIETPWPELTNADWLHKRRLGPKASEVFKTWFRVRKLERLPARLKLDDFEPAEGVLRAALLNQSAFGYAFLPESKTVGIESQLQRQLGEFLSSFAKARQEEQFSSEASPYQLIAAIRNSFAELPSVARRKQIAVKESVGRGNWSTI
ncbi:MAG: hypothetical protein H0W68_07655, partial [Gemmatimonadaceae bacterium]|nr:hypothetical protein [Gemmatimonadaceae bacterium]